MHQMDFRGNDVNGYFYPIIYVTWGLVNYQYLTFFMCACVRRNIILISDITKLFFLINVNLFWNLDFFLYLCTVNPK